MERKLLVLGAGSKLGGKIIEGLSGNYSKIIAQYRSSEQEIRQLEEQLGEQLTAVKADFMQDAELEYLIGKIREEKTVTDIVHLTANKIQYKRFSKTTWDDVERDLTIQLKSAWKIFGAVLPQMKKNGFGRIVIVLSSCTVNTPPKYLSGYVTSKYAMLGMMKSLATEYASKNILINAVSPGMMDTKFLEHVPQYVIENTQQHNPMQRLADTSDIYPAVKMLLSEENGYITGQNLVITGGE